MDAIEPPPPPADAPLRKPGALAPVVIGLALMVLLAVVIQRMHRDAPAESAADPANAKAEGFGNVLADWGEVPEFALVDRESRPFGRDRMTGHVCVVNFFFTSCPGPCLNLTRKMRSVMSLFRGDPRVQLVSISVDPDSDTPEQLSLYARVQGCEVSTWHFLTGAKEEVKKACAGFLAPFAAKDEAGDIVHSTKIYVVDAKGRMRSIIDSQLDPQWLERAAHDVRLLLEPAAGAGAR
jgi:protein SCO1/2